MLYKLIYLLAIIQMVCHGMFAQNIDTLLYDSDSVFSDTIIVVEISDSLSDDDFIADTIFASVDSVKEDTVIMIEDDLADSDSVWMNDAVFNSSLIIPSYEELLEVYYESVVAVDSRINFNPFRYRPDYNDPINPFVYSEIILVEPDLVSLDDVEQVKKEQSKDPFDKTPQEVYNEVQTYVSFANPPLVTSSWDQLPNPPKAEKVDIIYNVDLDMSVIDSGTHEMVTPKKIAKQKYAYKPWEVKLVMSLNASQTLFSNWAKGGTNQFSISGQVVSDIDYISYDKNMRWDNNVEARLGYLHNQDKSFVKNLDLVRINSQFAYNAFSKWFYAFNSEFTSQFFDGYDLSNTSSDDPISAILSPAYVKLSLGMDYKYGTKKNKKIFSVQASPFSYKMTLVGDTSRIDQTKYGVDDDKLARQELGGSLRLASEYALGDKFSARSNLTLFSNYIENPENVDVNWNTNLTYN